MKESRSRSAVPDEFKWKPEHIFAGVQDWEQNIQRVRDIAQALKGHEGTLTEIETIKKCFVLLDELNLLADRLQAYAYFCHHQEKTEPQANELVTRIDRVLVELREDTSFIEPEILGLPSDAFDRFLSAEELSFYGFTLKKMDRRKAHVLPKEQEAIVARAGILSQLPQTAYDLLNDADMKFPTMRDDDDNEVELTHARYGKFLESKNRRVRRDAFQGMFSSYRKQQHTITGLFNGNVQKDIFYAKTLRYPSTRSMALFEDNIPLEVYDNVITTVHRHLPLFHRYLRLKKEALHLDELHVYDLTVPIVDQPEWKFEYGQARVIVQKALEPLGEEYGRIVQRAFTEGWIDVYENQAKHSGAYSWGVYGIHPYLLMNFEGTLNDVFTLAHEMGHAAHSFLSNTHQKYHYAPYSIFIAEIASTLNEALLFKYLINYSQDDAQRNYLLADFLDGFRATVIVQTLFAEFEKIVHELAEAGVPLTLEKLNKVYYQLHREYYGEEVVLDKEIEIGWMRIPHFYSSFYVYKYATGFSAAQSFSNRLLNGNKKEVGKYLGLLKSGGTDFPLNLLMKAGLDMSQSKPIIEAFGNFGQALQQLEKHLRSVGRHQ